MAAYQDAIAHQLKCPVCMETFKEAKDLSCGHTFCKKCIAALAKGRRRIVCPECRQETFIERNLGISKLKSNILANRMVEALKNKDATVDHRVRPTKETGPVCKKHQPNLMKYFCEKCQELICSECSMENHYSHSVTPAKTVVLTRAMQNILDASDETKQMINDLQQKYPTGHPLLESRVIRNSKSKFDESFRSLAILQREFNDKLRKVKTEELAKFSKSHQRGKEMLARGNEVEIITNYQQWSEEMKANDLRGSMIPSMDVQFRAIEDKAHTCLTHLRKLESVLSELCKRRNIDTWDQPQPSIRSRESIRPKLPNHGPGAKRPLNRPTKDPEKPGPWEQLFSQGC
ncbi:E3 ubiquitin-protein ligase TRIM50-like [Diadema antillarum]|uniref:E3 ubiquitin-protein ligase TRIM50-like n=1 Tax=Diadema antillarum TaxID=105358 RepID=UPI003A8AE939